MGVGACQELMAGFQRMETGVQRKGRERAVTRKRARPPATPRLFPLVLLLRAKSRKTPPVSSAFPSFRLVPLLLETGDRSRGRLDFNQCPVPGASTSALTARHTTPLRLPPHTHPWGLGLDRDLTGLGVLCRHGDPQSDDQSEARRKPGSARLSFPCRFFRRRESDTHRPIYLGLLKHTTILGKGFLARDNSHSCLCTTKLTVCFP